jgi:hypothetical protein
VLFPKLRNLLLALGQEMVEVVDKQHALPPCAAGSSPAKQDVESVFGRGKSLGQPAFWYDLETREANERKRSGVHGDIMFSRIGGATESRAGFHQRIIGKLLRSNGTRDEAKATL